MATARTAFEDLPASVHTAIEERTGRLLTIGAATAGFTNEISARVHSTTDTCYIKGLRTDHSRAWTQRREAEVNPYLRGIRATAAHGANYPIIACGLTRR